MVTGVCSFPPGTDGSARARLQGLNRSLTQAPLRRAKLWKTQAQAAAGKGVRGGIMLSHALRMGSVQRTAHKTRDISRVLFLNLDRKSTRLNSSHLGISYAV